MFAVIQTGGKQYLVQSGQSLKIEKLDVPEGGDVIFDQVLLLAKDDGTDVKIGTPFLEGVSVAATVEAQTRSKKLRVVKFKNKIRYKRTHCHRQHQTRVKVAEVS